MGRTRRRHKPRRTRQCAARRRAHSAAASLKIPDAAQRAFFGAVHRPLDRIAGRTSQQFGRAKKCFCIIGQPRYFGHQSRKILARQIVRHYGRHGGRQLPLFRIRACATSSFSERRAAHRRIDSEHGTWRQRARGSGISVAASDLCGGHGSIRLRTPLQPKKTGHHQQQRNYEQFLYELFLTTACQSRVSTTSSV